MSNRGGRIVTEEDAEQALSYLRDSAREIGNAKGETVRASHMLKVTKALMMKGHNDKAVAAQEREALTSKEYFNALVRDAETAAEYERLKALREAAAMTLEIFRTEGANYRAMRI